MPLVEVICVGRYGIIIIVIGKLSSLSSRDGFCQVFISWMLAVRAAKSIHGGGGARERGVSLLVGSWVVVIVVRVIIVIVLSLLWWDEIGGFIALMLAANAARSMCSGGGASEIVVFWVVGAGGVFGSERVRNNDQCITVGSWSLKVQPLEIGAVGTCL